MDYTPQQYAAITSRSRRICVDAGAGSGKTRVLIDRIAYLIEQGAIPLEQIVAITFTDKAAGEMKQRLREKFREKAKKSMEDPPEMSRWRTLERNVAHARISTIHAFCAGILRENTLRLGMDPDFAVLTDADAVLLRQTVVRDTLNRLLEADDPSFKLAATSYSAGEVENFMHLLLQRRGLVHRVAAQWPLTEPQALTEAWCTAFEKERKRRLLSLPHDSEVLHQLHRLEWLACKCLNADDAWERQRLQMCNLLRILRNSTRLADILRVLGQLAEMPRPRGVRKNWDGETCYNQLKRLRDDLIEWASGLMQVPAEDETSEAACARMTTAVYNIFQHVDFAYAAAKESAGACDFDDLIELCVHALQSHEDIRTRVASSINCLLVDEFQDTDGTQAQMVRALVTHLDGPSLFIVGDPKQSIYYFRGAEVEVFTEARSEAEEQILLDQNFRSLPEVLEFVNAFFSDTRLLDRFGNFARMQAHRTHTREPRVEFLLEPPRAEHEKINAEERRRREAALIAARIHEMCAGSAPLLVETEKAQRQTSFGDVAMLFRALDNIHLYEEALRRAGVPYVLVQGRGFYQVQEVLDILNFLKSVIDGGNGPALVAFLRGPFACLSDDALFWLARQHDQGLVEAFNSGASCPLEAEKLQAARQLLQQARAQMDWPLPRFLQWLLDVTAFEAVLLTQFHGIQKAANVRKLVELAAGFSRDRPPSLHAFVQYLEEIRVHGVREGEAAVPAGGEGAVTIMSIHQAKGLEFPVVVIPDMGRPSAPPHYSPVLLHRELGMAVRALDECGETCSSLMFAAIQCRKEEEEQAESARLLYVALTRARDYLLLSGSCDGASKSWMNTFKYVYALEEHPHNALIQGERWTARIVREANTPLVSGKSALSSSLQWDELRRQVQAVSAPEASIIPISRLLDQLAGAPGLSEDEEAEPYLDDFESAVAGRNLALARGTAIHRLFEIWDFGSNMEPDLEYVLDDAHFGLRLREAMRAELQDVVRQFQQQPLYKVLANAARLEKELPFLWNIGGRQVSGVIDLLMNGSEIVDYKTGRPSPEKLRRYTLQLQLYALAARALTGSTPCKGLLVFVDVPKVEAVTLEAGELDKLERAVLRLLGSSAAAPVARLSKKGERISAL